MTQGRNALKSFSEGLHELAAAAKGQDLIEAGVRRGFVDSCRPPNPNPTIGLITKSIRTSLNQQRRLVLMSDVHLHIRDSAFALGRSYHVPASRAWPERRPW